MRSLSALVLATLLAVPAVLAEDPPRAAAAPLATVDITPDEVRWETQLDQELVLSIARPDGVVLRRDVAAGQPPSFSVFDAAGQRLPDGAYTYELRTTGEPPPGRSLLLSGSLAIRDGSFVEVQTLDRAPEGLTAIFEAADTVISYPDDLVVTGGTCLGFECTDGEPSVELRLKSSSAEIVFEDTGGGLSGARDWGIYINGPFGDESFKIRDLDAATFPFTLKSGAPEHSLFVSSSGNVGLGTSVPSSSLHVIRSDGTAQLAVTELNATTAGRTLLSLENNGLTSITLIDSSGGGAAGWQLGNLSTSSVDGFVISRQGDGVNEFVIKDNGNVGIGTTSVQSKLHVNGGDIRVSGGSFIDDGVTLNAPDYVFEPGYELMPLAELEAFVRREKHLPNVPKAAEIRASGLNLSQFQMRLLEKIEELTLYTLAQQEQIADLRAKVEMLEAK